MSRGRFIGVGGGVASRECDDRIAGSPKAIEAGSANARRSLAASPGATYRQRAGVESGGVRCGSEEHILRWIGGLTGLTQLG